jgi:hypothetical protein
MACGRLRRQAFGVGGALRFRLEVGGKGKIKDQKFRR